MNPALLQKGSNSYGTDSEIKDHEGFTRIQGLEAHMMFTNTCILTLVCLSREDSG